ncbi:Uncharacterized protein BM_BM7526 [Brugia malayi]|uniref:Dihydrolipoamide acetyltransferase component of pyruvate dehydrogenase complex n=3 Tax=Brugia malayi TaxID=6279 RepID=A0A158Q1K0_BRUMA|nr:Uncharacterized protein BM_BM7526 [Brugia malayi]CDP96839.1 Bm7526, isoform b [Brugia malayi]VIO94214.1 Uncharacterized protein BM_BM7526 [Brugia malayi]
MVSLIGRQGLYLLSRRMLFNSMARFLPLVQFKLSDIGEGIAEVQIKEWHVKEGDHVAQFDNICEVQSDKASVTITSRYDGVIKKLYYDVEDVAKIGTTLVDIEVADVGGNRDGKLEREMTTSDNAQEARKILASPAVRQLAKEKGVNLNEITGTGISGHILKDDIISYVERQTDSSTATVADVTFHAMSPLSHSLPLEEFEMLKKDKMIPIRGYTRAMVKSMTESLKIPHLGFCDEVNFDRLITMRKELRNFEIAYNARMSFMPIIIKAVSLALKKFPRLNAIVDENMENVICKASHNISIAMDTPEGLVVPNIKHCEQRTLWEVAAELNRLQEASGKMKIDPDDLKDGTFTLSNIGVLGGTYLMPVIMAPQLAIGAIGQISKLPRFNKEGNICEANVVKFSWAADHRVIDGATVARFSSQVKRYLENPSNMVADLR